MRTKLIATYLAALFIATLAVPWTVLAGGEGGKDGGGSGRMGGESIGIQNQMQKQIGTRDMERHRMRDGEGDRNRDRDRDRIHKESGTEPSATTMGSAVDAASEKGKGYTYGLRDGTGPFYPKDGTGFGVPANR